MKQKIRRDERVKIRGNEREFFQGGVRKEIDFYPVRKIVKKTSG